MDDDTLRKILQSKGYPEDFTDTKFRSCTISGINKIKVEIQELDVKRTYYRDTPSHKIWIKELKELMKHIG